MTHIRGQLPAAPAALGTTILALWVWACRLGYLT